MAAKLVEISGGMSELRADLERHAMAPRNVGPKTLRAAGDRILERAKDLAPRFYPQGGALPESLFVKQTSDGVEVGTDLEWAEDAHEDFTQRHAHGGPKYVEVPVLQEGERVSDELDTAIAKHTGGGE